MTNDEFLEVTGRMIEGVVLQRHEAEACFADADNGDLGAQVVASAVTQWLEHAIEHAVCMDCDATFDEENLPSAFAIAVVKREHCVVSGVCDECCEHARWGEGLLALVQRRWLELWPGSMPTKVGHA